MGAARLPSLVIGNGRLLVTLDSSTSILSACWPCIDSPNQVSKVNVEPVDSAHEPEGDSDSASPFGYEKDTNIAFGHSKQGLKVKDFVFDLDSVKFKSDVHVRQVCGPHPALMIHLIPELDGRPGAQTIYWDELSQALLAFCRDKWVAVGCKKNRIYDFHCGRRSEDDVGTQIWRQNQLPKERIAVRSVYGTLRICESTDSTNIFLTYGHTCEAVLDCLNAVRDVPWEVLEQKAKDRAFDMVSALKLFGWSPSVDRILSRSCLVLDVLTNRDTGGTIAGPDVQSGIESAPGYAAVWGRDAAWTMLGALAMGCEKQVERMIRFALVTQAPEGLWLHRHHTDGTMASSWGLHQIDETGIYLHAFACYFQKSGRSKLLQESWNVISKAANFLLSTIDQATSLPIDSVDLWEEREGLHLYTAASVIAGLRAASHLASQLTPPRSKSAAEWAKAAKDVQAATLKHFWAENLGRFVNSTHSSAALPMVDSSRPDLTANVQDGISAPETAIPQYPNWRDVSVLDMSHRHDVSVLSLVVPFGILPADDERMVKTANQLRQNLWNNGIGGFRRYEGDTYGGGNPWPLATLWLATYEAARGKIEEARLLAEWVISHTTEAGLVPEQVHRETAKPVAAVPLSWSHGMIALAVAAVQGKNVWKPSVW